MSEGRHMCMYMWPRVMWQQCYVTPCHVPWDVKQVVDLSWWAGGSGWPRALLFTLCATYHPFRALLITPSSN